MLRPGNAGLTVLLAIFSATIGLHIDILLPSLPDIARGLEASRADVQLTISAFLVGTAFGTLIYGPISDRFGRRPVLLLSLALYCAGSLVCATAPRIEILVGGRILQALGPAGMVVLSRAIIRDLYEGAQVAREMSTIAAVAAFAPLLTPIVGGAAQAAMGWRGVFAVLLVFGVALTLVVWVKVPESLPAKGPLMSPRIILAGYGAMVTNRIFGAYTSIVTTSYVGIVMWLAGSSFVLQEYYGLSPLAFSVMFVVVSSGYFLGTTVAARFGARGGINQMLGIGVMLQACGGIAMAAAIASGAQSVVFVIGPMMVYTFGLGNTIPQGFAGAMIPFRHNAGAASSLTGFIQQALGAVTVAVAGQVLGETPMPLALMVAAAGCCSLALWVLTRRVRADIAGLS